MKTIDQQILSELQKVSQQNQEILQVLTKKNEKNLGHSLPINKLSWIGTAMKKFGFFGTVLLTLGALILYGLIWIIEHPAIYR